MDPHFSFRLLIVFWNKLFLRQTNFIYKNCLQVVWTKYSTKTQDFLIFFKSTGTLTGHSRSRITCTELRTYLQKQHLLAFYMLWRKIASSITLSTVFLKFFLYDAVKNIQCAWPRKITVMPTLFACTQNSAQPQNFQVRVLPQLSAHFSQDKYLWQVKDENFLSNLVWLKDMLLWEKKEKGFYKKQKTHTLKDNLLKKYL